MLDIFPAVEELHDRCDVGIGHQIVVGAFFEEILTRSINELNFGIGLVLGEHEDVDGNGGAVEEVRSQ